MLHHRNPHFVGRVQSLKTFAEILKRHDATTVAVTQVAGISGIGGVGKTQLASEFAHRYGRYFAGGVFWLSLAEPELIPSEVARCGDVGGLNLGLRYGVDYAALRLPIKGVGCLNWRAVVYEKRQVDYTSV